MIRIKEACEITSELKSLYLTLIEALKTPPSLREIDCKDIIFKIEDRISELERVMIEIC